MEANEKKSKDFLIIKNRTEHVLEENKHAETKISKQQKTDKNTHAQQTNKTRTFNYRKPEITTSCQNAKQQNRCIEDKSHQQL